MGLLDKFPSWSKTNGKGNNKVKHIGTGGIKEQIEKANIYSYSAIRIGNDGSLILPNTEKGNQEINFYVGDIIHIKPELLADVNNLISIIQDTVGIGTNMKSLFNQEFTIASMYTYYMYVEENPFAWPIKIFNKGTKGYVAITNSLLQCINCGTTYLISEVHECVKSEEIQSEI